MDFDGCIAVWFAAPNTDGPAGGIHNYYQLCKIFDVEFHVKAMVMSHDPYLFLTPGDGLEKYWYQLPSSLPRGIDGYDHADIRPGDLIIWPELYWRCCRFTKPVLVVSYIQNWLLATPITWQRDFWIYSNSANLSFSVNNMLRNATTVARSEHIVYDCYHRDWDRYKTFIDDESNTRVDFSIVTPFFDPDKFSFDTERPSRTPDGVAVIMVFPQKSADRMAVLQSHLDVLSQTVACSIVVVDNMPHLDVIRCMEKSHVVMLPSFAEGLCFPAIEAMLSGAVVVTWPCGGPEEFVINGETGMLAEYNDVEGLVERTKEILQSPPERWKRIRQNARRLAERLYTKSKTTTELYVAYHRACERSRRKIARQSTAAS